MKLKNKTLQIFFLKFLSHLKIVSINIILRKIIEAWSNNFITG